MTKNFNWIHLSDIHFNYDGYDTYRMRDLLIDYIKELKTKFNILIITGDIVYKFGKYNEELFEFLNDIFKVTGVSKDQVYIVPGNHDLKRSSKRRLIINGVVSDPKSIYKEVNEMISEEDTFTELLEAQNEFWQFYEKVLGRKDNYKNLHFVIAGDNYNIINLNTCLLCGIDKEEGKLSIGLDRLAKTLRTVKGEKKINIAIGHHSIECFNQEERKKIMNNFIDYDIDLYLCGHMHKNKYDFNNNNKREFVTLVCGANMVDDYADASFITGTINCSNGECGVKYHSWSKCNEQWYKNNDIGRKLNNGKLEFELSRLKKNFTIDSAIDEIEETDELENIDIDEDSFKRFIIDFNNSVINYSIQKIDFCEKDIKDKFKNMKCSSSLIKEFDRCSWYFPLINNIMDTSAYIEYDRKIIIPGVIMGEYEKVLNSFNTGTEIMGAMIDNIYNRYKNKLKYAESKLRSYIKTMIYWSINECDIYDDEKE